MTLVKAWDCTADTICQLEAHLLRQTWVANLCAVHNAIMSISRDYQYDLSRER